MPLYLLLTTLSVLGMIVILVALGILRLLDAGRLPNILIDGYAAILAGFISLVFYVYLVRLGFIVSMDTRIVYLTALGGYLLLTNILVLARMTAFLRHTIHMTRGIDGSQRDKPVGLNGREVEILAGKLRVKDPDSFDEGGVILQRGEDKHE